MIIVDWHLSDCARKSYRQLAAWINVAEKNVGDRVTRLGSTHPRHENRGHIIDYPAKRQRPAVDYNDDRWFARRLDRFDEIHLAARQIERAARRCLAAHFVALADKDECHV